MTAYKVLRTNADGSVVCVAKRKSMDDALDVKLAYEGFDEEEYGITESRYRIQIVVNEEG